MTSFFRKYSYNKTKMTEQKHTTTVQRSITSENGKRYGNPMVCWSPAKI